MYTPKHFDMPEREEQLRFIAAHPFGILVSGGASGPRATHAPFVVLRHEPRVTLGLHVAKANPHWQMLEGAPVLCIFHGAHDFVSVSWYEDRKRNVPTWNYSAVHCTGAARLVDDRGLAQILEATVEQSEAGRWRVASADPEYIENNRRAIVGIEVDVDAIDGKLKYSQNRSETDRESVIAHLEEQDSPLAPDMRAYYGA